MHFTHCAMLCYAGLSNTPCCGIPSKYSLPQLSWAERLIHIWISAKYQRSNSPFPDSLNHQHSILSLTNFSISTNPQKRPHDRTNNRHHFWPAQHRKSWSSWWPLHSSGSRSTGRRGGGKSLSLTYSLINASGSLDKPSSLPVLLILLVRHTH